MPKALQSVLMGLLFCATPLALLCSEPIQYGFEEGEPLDYQLRLAASHQALHQGQWYGDREDSPESSQMQLNLRYQLMPITRSTNGLWKIRVVFEHAEQMVNQDGERKTNAFNRAALGVSRLDPYDFMKTKVRDLFWRSEFLAITTNTSEDLGATNSLPVKESFLDNPLVAWVSPNGALQALEQRPELEQLMPGVNFKECFELTMPALPSTALSQGATWTRIFPLALPQPPLAGYKPAPMVCPLTYTIGKMTEGPDSPRAVISVAGQVVHEGLSIPIRQDEFKYLIWTTSITRIEDRLQGEIVLDLKKRIVLKTDITTTSRYTTVASRKEDKHRARIVSEHEIQTQLSSQAVASTPSSSNTVTSSSVHSLLK